MSRIVILERLKKLYATFSIPKLLTEHGIEDHQLIPPIIVPKKYFNLKTMNKSNFTPLCYYDNTEFDSRNPDEWVTRDVHYGIQLPVPATVYLPISSDDESPKIVYKWTKTNIIEYNPESKLYSVILLKNPTKVHARLPRIQIHFDGEDPREFVKRIKYAILRRDYCEKIMLWYMYIDKIKIDDISTQFTNEIIQKILNLVLKNNQKIIKEIKFNVDSVVEDIVNFNKRSQCSSLLRYKISKNPKKFEYIKLPNFEFEDFVKKLVQVNTGMQNYTDVRVEFIKNRLLVLPEVFTAIWNSNIENLMIKERRLFTTTFFSSITLEEFETTQLENIFRTMNSLKSNWIRRVNNKCYEALKNIKSGWFNISSSNFKIYQSSINKLRKLITVIQYMMERYLRNLVINSVNNYAILIEKPCSSTIHINNDFVWGSNLFNSPFEGSAPPIFSIMLNMNVNGPFYSTNPNKYESTIINILKKGVIQSHEVPLFHIFLLTNMKFFDKPNLTSIGLLEDGISNRQKSIEKNIRSAIIPLKAYCKKFIIYLPLFNTDVQSYVQIFFDGKPSLIQIKDEISIQLKMKSNLTKTLPETIIIGPFLVNLKPLKRFLIEKRNELANLLMKTHASITTEQIEICCEEYRGIYLKLNENPVSIEQAFEMRDWIDSIPILVKNQSEIAKRFLMDMDMLDTFLWIVDNEQLQQKWEVKIWPYKIDLVTKEYLEKLGMEIEKFEKVQYEDELLLQDKVEYVGSAILKLTIENNVSKVFEIAVEVSKNWKLIEDLQLFSQTLNVRQKLFGQPISPFENVKQLVYEFEPYKELWLGAAEFLKMQNAWLQNPLTDIDRNSLEPLLSDFLQTMIKSVEWFAEIPGTLSVANEIKTQIENYKPTMELLKDIRNPGMKQRHWDKLANETGVKIILLPSLTLKKCLELGVGNHTEKLRRLSKNASEEYVIELALDKMIKEWDGVKLQLLPYKDTGTYTMKISNEELQMLDDHILITEQLSKSSFKGVFEEQLNTWKEKLNLAKDVLKAWIEFQKQWTYLESIFSQPDIKDQLHVESKKFRLVVRTWKQIMNMAVNKPWVMKFCPDDWLLKVLISEKHRIDLIQKKLTDYLETKKSIML